MGHARTSRRATRVAGAFLALGVGAGLARPVDPSSDDVAPGRFRCAATGAEFRVVRDEATGRKRLERPDGMRFESVEAAVASEELALSPIRRAVDPELWSAVEDPARSGELLRVVLVLRRQPVHEASLPARARAAQDIAPKLAALRRPLDRIAALRAPAADRLVQVGDLIEEEARLLTPAERDEGRRLREEVRDRIRAMRLEILAAARPLVEADQAPVVDFVRAIPGARVLGSTLVFSAVAAEIPAGRIADVAGLPGVEHVLPDAEQRASLDTSVPTIGAASWTGAGYAGSSSTKVAILDTGVDGTHPALAGAVAAGHAFQGTTDDLNGHGTHVAGIVASRDATYRGVAPGALVLNAKFAYSGGTGSESEAMAAADWAVGAGADVMNYSFGTVGAGHTDGTQPMSRFLDAVADDLGISVAAAAGNGWGAAGSLSTPADGFNVIAVGNFGNRGTVDRADDVLDGSSSHGPALDGRRKPDIAAPGTSISSCSASWEGSNPDFVSLTGTSMAAPHVAGSLALLADYAASWRPEGMKALLLATTRNRGPVPAAFDSGWGWGGLDLAAAFTSRATVLENTFTAAGPAVAWLHAPSMAAGARAALCWNREVPSNGSNAPVTYRGIVDLDLFVYDSDGGLLGASDTLLDSVERATLAAPETAPVIKVVRAGPFPSGQTSVDWAIATDAASSATAFTPAPPALACSLSLDKDIVKIGETFTVDSHLVNSGGMAAHAPAVTLSLPAGFSVVSGANPQTVATLAAGGGTSQATWTVRSGPGESETQQLTVSAVSDSFGDTYSASAAASVGIDIASPWGVVTLDGGAAAVPGPQVTVGVEAHAGADPLAGMRVRNAGDVFGPWGPVAASFPWTIAPSRGRAVVEVQLVDMAGRESAVFAGSIFMDPDPPSGSFTISGDAEYLMPWEPATADVPDGDGDGSGVTELRVRWGTGDWSAWHPTNGAGIVELERPAQRGAVTAQLQLEDAAGNVSAATSDGVYLVEDNAPSLDGASVYSGTLAAGADVDAFRIGLLKSDLLSVRLSVRPATKKADFRGAVDVFRPDHTQAVTGRWPADARRPGLTKFVASTSGEHWIVLRSEGAERTAGGTYALSVRVRPDGLRHRRNGTLEPANGLVSIPVDAEGGTLLGGAFQGDVTGVLSIVGPDESIAPWPLTPGPRHSFRIRGAAFGAATGRYTLFVHAVGGVTYDLRLTPAKRRRLAEAGD